jgi:non-ribosomal peptide synthetase component F
VAEGAGAVALVGRLDWHDRALLCHAPPRWSGARLEGVLRRRASPPEGRRWGADEGCMLGFSPAGPLSGRLVPAQGLDAFVTSWREELAVGSNDRVAWTHALPWDFGLWGLLLGLSAGATVLAVPEAAGGEPAAMARWVQQREVSVWCSAPAALLGLLRAGLCEPDPPGDLRCVVCAGEPLAGSDALDLVRMLPWCRAWTVFPDPSTGHVGYELPDWFDPSDPPLAHPVLALTTSASADARPGLRDTA